MAQDNRILLLEDEPSDAALIERTLRDSGLVFSSRRVATREEFVRALEEFPPHLILADYALPAFDGLAAARIAKRRTPDAPIIIVTGKLPDKIAALLTREGVRDYVLKDDLARLGPVAQRALEEARNQLTDRRPEPRVRVLILDDTPGDIDLMERELKQSGLSYEARRVATRREFESAVKEFAPDVILADYTLPDYDALTAIHHAAEHVPDVPVIIVTGTLTDELASLLLREGASDYVLKDRLARLGPAVRRALEDAREERERREAEVKYRTIFAEAHDGIVLVDGATGFIVDCNEEFVQRTGRTREELLNMEIWTLHPPEQVTAGQRTFQEIQDTGGGEGSHLEVLRPDGSRVAIEFHAKALMVGSRRCILFIGRDITERKQGERMLRESEERFRGVVEQSLAGIYIIESDRFRYVNPRFAEIFGYGSAEEIINRVPFAILVAPADRDLVVENVRRRLAGESFEMRYGFSGLRKDGMVIDVEVHSRAFQFEGKHAVIGVLLDITERRRAERELAQQLEELRRFQKATVDRELRMREVMEQNRRLEAENQRLRGSGKQT